MVMSMSISVSGGLISTFLSGETASFAVPFSSSSPCPRPVHLRVVRTPTLATASKQASTGKGELRGIMKPRRVSPEMQALVGLPEISRTQALKLIWAHIKENNLQDPENKKIIVCDDKLKKIFKGRDRVGFLEIAGLITPHFL
ncbi:p53 negative regulator [Parasponia andersonii]|uniref:p53 negative regulator n=1 Tax=Parasponia andersonii TaxID=3476 RepID=A0A2P5DNA1_PARAD|nr:p53 negative regulator [Parasponia andersonii]